MGITPTPGLTYVVSTGGNPVVVVPPNPNGGVIVNPLLATDQGITNAEPLYVCPCGNAALQANNITFAIQPGQSWNIIPGQTTQTTVNAITSGHSFAVVYW